MNEPSRGDYTDYTDYPMFAGAVVLEFWSSFGRRIIGAAIVMRRYVDSKQFEIVCLFVGTQRVDVYLTCMRSS